MTFELKAVWIESWNMDKSEEDFNLDHEILTKKFLVVENFWT